MKKFLSGNQSRFFVGASAAILVCGSAATAVAQRPFSFIAVEFMPRDQRLPAAQAFVAASAAPGTPIRVAEAALSRAGAYCHGGRRQDGVVSCSLTSVVGHSDEESQNEVTWRVQITPDADGAVAAANVSRITDGF